jgi:GntP family gluconate:H+ symporter
MLNIAQYQAVTAGMGSVFVMIVSLVIIILMITWLKINPVYAMLVGAIGAGIAFGIPLEGVIPVVMNGFGTTIGNIGLVILLGCTIGIILEQTGGALVIANTILRWVGRKNGSLAMMIAGYLVSIPVFSDTAIVIMSPVARTVSARSGVPRIATLGALNAGIMATHTIVPPTPGPLAAAGTLGVDLGLMIFLGLFVALAYSVAGWLWVSSRFCTSRFPNPAKVEGIEELVADDFTIKTDRPLPGAPLTFACLLVPIFLICFNSLGRIVIPLDHAVIPYLGFVGHPIMALSIGVLMCFFLAVSELSREQIGKWFSKSVDTSAFIILATGTAGSYGFILRASGVGEFMGQGIAATALPAVFIPFFVTMLLVLSNGSATVSLITGSAIMLPLLPYLGLHPVIVALALTAGASFFYHVNASHYWVVVRSDNLTMKEGFFNVSGGTAIGSFAAMAAVYVLSLVVHP